LAKEKQPYRHTLEDGRDIGSNEKLRRRDSWSCDLCKLWASDRNSSSSGACLTDSGCEGVSDTGDSIVLEGSISWVTEEKRTWLGCDFDLASASPASDGWAGILVGDWTVWKPGESTIQACSVRNTEMPVMPIAQGVVEGGQDIPDSIELAVGVEHSAVSDVILIDEPTRGLRWDTCPSQTGRRGSRKG
jgi:hypothetical protein